MGVKHTAHSSQANRKQERLNLTIANLFRTLLSDNSLLEYFGSYGAVNASPAKRVNWFAPMRAFLNGASTFWAPTSCGALWVQLHELQERSLALRNAQARKVHPKVRTVQIGDYVMVRNRKQMLAKLKRRWRGSTRVVATADTKLDVTVEDLGERGRHRCREGLQIFT